MKIKYEIDDSLQEDEIIIKTKQLSDKILELDRLLSSDTVDTVIGINDKKYFPIKTVFIERIYSENRKVFIYSKGDLYESKKTLAEFEVILNVAFVRISKSEIVNTKHIKSIQPEYSGNFTLIFISGNESILSRKYVKQLKSAIGLEG
jgi:DNA-binding LytR/AlgR family response regulator